MIAQLKELKASHWAPELRDASKEVLALWKKQIKEEQETRERRALVALAPSKAWASPNKQLAAGGGGGGGGLDEMDVDEASDDDESVEMVGSSDTDDDVDHFLGIPRQPTTLTAALWGQLCRQFSE